MTAPEYQSEMLAEVRHMLEQQRGSWQEICGDLHISYHWMTKMVQGQISNPGINKVEQLHKYLTARFPRAAA